MARPTKLTPEIHTAIVTSITNGNYAIIAAKAAGISETSYYEWLKRGTEGDNPPSPFAEFAEAIACAEAKAEARSVGILAGSDDWRAHTEYLKRRYPNRWSERIESTGAGGEALKVELEHRGVALSDVLALAERTGAAVPDSRK